MRSSVSLLILTLCSSIYSTTPEPSNSTTTEPYLPHKRSHRIDLDRKDHQSHLTQAFLNHQKKRGAVPHYSFRIIPLVTPPAPVTTTESPFFIEIFFYVFVAATICLGILAVIIIICCCMRKRRTKIRTRTKTLSDEEMPLVSNRKINRPLVLVNDAANEYTPFTPCPSGPTVPETPAVEHKLEDPYSPVKYSESESKINSALDSMSQSDFETSIDRNRVFPYIITPQPQQLPAELHIDIDDQK